MSSFSCPYVFSKDNNCLKLKTECVPGRPGCVLANKFQFAVPVEQRLAEMEKIKQKKKKKD